jgi:uncharacterized coiled-coil DUF342 family protein
VTIRAGSDRYVGAQSELAVTGRQPEPCELGLGSQSDARVDRDRILDLEIEAQRRELEVRFSYEAALEERLLDFQHQIESLHGHIAARERDFSVERQRLMDELTVATTQTAEALKARDDARREREAAHDELERAHREHDDVHHERDGLQHELDAERRRISYRIVQRVIAEMKKPGALLIGSRTSGQQ